MATNIFRLNQRVCRVDWKDGQPCLAFGRVTRATRSTYYVDGSKDRGLNWHDSLKRAMDAEYYDLFAMWDSFMGKRSRPAGWTIQDTVRCVCRVRRLDRRLCRRKIRG